MGARDALRALLVCVGGMGEKKAQIHKALYRQIQDPGSAIEEQVQKKRAADDERNEPPKRARIRRSILPI